MSWKTYIDADTFDIERFAKSLVKNGNEAIKWERRKLQWILEEKEADRQKLGTFESKQAASDAAITWSPQVPATAINESARPDHHCRLKRLR